MDTVERNTSYVPLYRQLALIVKKAIEEGEFLPGERLPTERELAERQRIGPDTVRDAMKVLRAWKLVTTVRGVGTFVSQHQPVTEHAIPDDAVVTARPASAKERHQLRIVSGGYVLVVVSGEGDQQVYPADRTQLRSGNASKSGAGHEVGK